MLGKIFTTLCTGILWIAGTALGAAGGWLAVSHGSEYWHWMNSRFSSQRPAVVQSGPGLDEDLVKVANQLNKMLPLDVDPITRWDSTSVEPSKTLTYRYTLTTLVKDQYFNEREFISLMKPKILQEYRTNSLLKDFRDQQVSLKYVYSDKNGAQLATIVVGPNRN